MDLSQYVRQLREDLAAAAGAGDEQTRQTAALLGAAVEPAARLAIMNALADLAAEVTSALGDRVVEVRLNGRDIRVAVSGEPAGMRPELGLNLFVGDAGLREQLLTAWHIRRWLVTMMSGAGHAQDTAINLVDIALRVAQEGLGASTAFYLIQNKYDNSDQNRPSQLPYDEGELGQRDKLARLLMDVTPGSRAYSINDWTPFGFKAGGMVGMDLVHEESMKLTNMLVLDRNANAHDLDSLMADLRLALNDPGVVTVYDVL